MSPDLSDTQLRALLAEGLSQREIARRTGIPRSTLHDRMKRLGLQVTPASPAPQGPPASRGPRVSPSTHAAPTSPAVTFVAVPEMQELLRLVKHLHGRVEVIEQTRVPPALSAAHTTPAAPTPPVTHVTPTAPAPPVAERKDVQQWTIRLSKGLIDHLKAVAYDRRVPPSQLIEEWLWQQARQDR